MKAASINSGHSELKKILGKPIYTPKRQAEAQEPFYRGIVVTVYIKRGKSPTQHIHHDACVTVELTGMAVDYTWT